MATAPFSIDDTTPGDSDIASQFPSNERSFRDTVDSWLQEEHDTYGHHKIMQDTTTNRDGETWSNGALFWNTTGDVFQVRVGGTWVSVGSPGATKEIFYQAAAPYGYTLDATVNDKVLRVTNGTSGGAGGAAGGSWTISGVTVDGHTLTIGQMPSHSHGPDTGGGRKFIVGTGASPRQADSNGNADGATSGVADATTGNTGGGSAHDHGVTADGLWRPAYYNVIICSKD